VLSEYSEPVHSSAEELKEAAGFSMIGRLPVLRTLQVFFGDCIIGRGPSATRFQDLTPPDYICGNFSKKASIRITHENPEGQKHTTEWTVTNIDPQTLLIVTRNTVKRANILLS
jgi:hypothetical protein